MMRKPAIGRTIAPEDLMEAIHGTDVYKGFDFGAFSCDLQGWGGNSPAFAELINEVRPVLVRIRIWCRPSALAAPMQSSRQRTPVACDRLVRRIMTGCWTIPSQRASC